MEKVIAIFDIGKTNKKLLLFNRDLKIVYQHEEIFAAIKDEDGCECDDLMRIEQWIKNSLNQLVNDEQYELAGINFSTYGASLAFIDDGGNLLSPVYNYLKPVDDKYSLKLFENYLGEKEFCRTTATPSLGVLLNSGIQLFWIKEERPDVYSKASHILHLPQYLSFLLTKKITADYTSIGCHTFMWDFDKMNYHTWLNDNNFNLPRPLANSTTYNTIIGNKSIPIGIGIHDSSASLAPYIQGSDKKFLLISTGTWCINMNPFNHSPLTTYELNQDCLCYLSVNQKPVKSSRFFMGYIHDINVSNLTKYFGVAPDSYKQVKPDENEIKSFLKRGNEKIFFKNIRSDSYLDTDVDLKQFLNFEKAYLRLLFDLTLDCASSIRLVLNGSDGVSNLYVSGGFARNEIFVRLLAGFFPEMQIYTSRVDNSSAMGAALVILNNVMPDAIPAIDLDLKKWRGYSEHCIQETINN